MITLNLSKLAQKIGVSQPAVYRYFPNKQALAISVAQRGFEQLAEALQKTTQNVESDSFKGIRAITKAYVEFALNNPEIARMMFSMKEQVTDPKLQQVSSSAAKPIFRIVEAAHSCDSLRNNDVVQAVWMSKFPL
ncbi:transcriptional regulator [Xenococcus sp. PCC 7305]|uniref:TetR/AcrR family transcriptional regulator n=1 Tax=Xenococcus sp. PCC 7305 TaxID=102125 RepID=UPI0002ABF3F1|nr:TetR/AcrR family transcriptional regulator [Xenococcus sp. PCC 7305]ELS02833.1 transcriptional regulator [Xenococcus sp. PCC 7305]